MIKAVSTLFIFIVGISGSLHLYGADFPASDIPADLKEKAVAVVRYYEKDVTIRRDHTTVTNVQEVVTVLKRSGANYGYNWLYYDQFDKVRSIKVTMYDASGKKVDTYNRADFTDRSAISGFSVFEDNRVMYLRPEHHTLPYTVAYEYTIESNQSLHYPRWYPQPAEEVSVQASHLKVTVPEKDYFRYKEMNLPEGSQMVLSAEKGDFVYSWQVSNLKAWKEEELSPSYHEYTPVVFTGANSFEMEGYEGDMSSWQNFGKWILTLNEGRDELPEETVAEIKRLVAGVPDTREKVAKLYKYMQDRTRYVSIQVGIGGFQPFEAMEVDQNSYGDCKALSNYMHAILKVAGIPSYYTLVNAGTRARQMVREFPSAQFNHAILCVPVATDTLWLECTSQTNPLGYTGQFTSDRDVLVINETGGHVVRTNVYSNADNTLSRKATVTVAADGNASATVVTDFKGVHYRDRDQAFHASQAGEQAKILYDDTHIPNFSIRDFTLEKSGDVTPTIRETLNLELPKYASSSGSRLFVPMKLAGGDEWSIDGTEDSRRTDIVIRYNYTYVDTIQYILPEAYHMEAMPFEEEAFESEVGSYYSRISRDEEGLLYIRRFEVKKGRYAPGELKSLKSFFSQVKKVDRAKTVFVDKS